MQGNWIEKNLDKFMAQIMVDARFQRPLPLRVNMHEVAYRKFAEILRSKGAYHPELNGKLKFLNIPIEINNNLPFGTFAVERFKSGVGLIRS